MKTTTVRVLPDKDEKKRKKNQHFYDADDETTNRGDASEDSVSSEAENDHRRIPFYHRVEDKDCIDIRERERERR